MKLRNILIGLLVLILGAGCKGKEEVTNSGEAISCTPTIKVVKMSGEDFTVKVSSSKPWFAAKDKKWVTVEPSSGLGNSDVTISVEAGQFDTAHVAFSNGMNDVTLTIYRGSKNDADANKNFIGTYELHTTMYIHKSKGVDTIAEYISDMTIYEDNGLMVQTELFGVPDTALTHLVQQQITFNDIYGIRNKVSKRIVNEEPTLIEVVKDSTAKIFMTNGWIMNLKDGIFLQPLPIPVKLASALELMFDNSTVFEVKLVQSDAFGSSQVYATADCYYEYGLLENKGTHLKWNVKLHVDYEPSSSIEEANLITYENIAYRKNK